MKTYLRTGWHWTMAVCTVWAILLVVSYALGGSVIQLAGVIPLGVIGAFAYSEIQYQGAHMRDESSYRKLVDAANDEESARLASARSKYP